MRLTPRQAFELARVCDRHGPAEVRLLPAGRVLVQVERGYVLIAVALAPDGRPVWSQVTAEPDRPALADVGRPGVRSACGRAGR